MEANGFPHPEQVSATLVVETVGQMQITVEIRRQSGQQLAQLTLVTGGALFHISFCNFWTNTNYSRD